jgi:23S rRNA (cytosine1962-C5)-methyltransferase
MLTSTLKEKEDRRILRGHPWAYRNEFAQLPVDAPDGAIIDVFAANRRFIGRGFYQAAGGIAVRMLARHQIEVDKDFWADRLSHARSYREPQFGTVYRWVHAESDGLPGLVVDRFDCVAVVESSCAFYREHANALAKALLATEGIRSVRMTFSGVTETRGEEMGTVEVECEGLRLALDFSLSQKTGLFLDQRINSRDIRRWSAGARVLDAHCYAGVWSCHAALAGAASVLGVDTSAPSLEMAKRNAALNGCNNVNFECADIGSVLKRGDRYDVVVLDPPALAKSRAHLTPAFGRYLDLNTAAISSLNPGGILVTSSCSHFVTLTDFMEMLKRAVRGSQRTAWILDTRGAAPDHPVLMGMPETEYLKCVTLRIE